MLIIDSHMHLGYTREFYFYDTSVSQLIKKMDSLNISFCINAHNEGLLHRNIEKSMVDSIRAYDESGKRILSYFIFNPYISNECIDLMEHYKNEKVFRGIKLHPSFHGMYADDPSYEVVWQYALDNNLPIMSHTWDLSSYNDSQKYSYPTRFEKYLVMYPQVKFICGHSGGRYNGIIDAAKLATKYNNVYLDTSGDVYNYQLIEFLTKKAGADKILFGSDALWFDQATQLGLVLGADIVLEDKEKILFRNAVNVFKLDNNIQNYTGNIMQEGCGVI